MIKMNAKQILLFAFYIVATCTKIIVADEVTDETPNGRLLAAAILRDENTHKVEDLDDLKKALEEGADINVVCDKSGQTPLMAAVLRGKLGLVAHLIEAGADTSIGEKSGFLPPHGAGFQGRPDVMKVLHKHGLDVNAYHEDGNSPLHRACWGSKPGHTATIRYLVEEAGVDVNEKSKDERHEEKSCWHMTKNEGTKDLLRELGAVDVTSDEL